MLLLLGGCDGRCSQKFTAPETSDRNFIRAVEHLRNEAYGDAIVCLNAVIASHDSAPESNLLLGTLHLDKKNDPIGAIYFLRKYVAECEDPGQIKIAEQLMDTAKKEFLKTLPAYNGIGQSEAELIEVARTLKNQNTLLQSQIAMYRQKISDCETRINALSGMEKSKEGAAKAKIWDGTEYIVQEGETLSSISSKCYGTPRAWQKILKANSSILKSPKELKAGQKLVIP
jgi:LysM repeat protein